MCETREKDLAFEDIDILASIGSDICESVRDLMYNIKELQNDIKTIKGKLKL